MKVRAKLLAAASAIVVIGALSAARTDAQTQTNVPATQGLESVDKNLAKDKDGDNRGLKNAQQRIEDNMQDRKERAATKVDGDDKRTHARDKDKARHDRADARVEKAAHPDRPERPERPERGGRS